MAVSAQFITELVGVDGKALAGPAPAQFLRTTAVTLNRWCPLMLDHDLLARCRTMLADEAMRLHKEARVTYPDYAYTATFARSTIAQVVTAEACDYAAQALHNVLSKADAYLDDEQAREALKR
jgi:hypothetical protein